MSRYKLIILSLLLGMQARAQTRTDSTATWYDITGTTLVTTIAKGSGVAFLPASEAAGWGRFPSIPYQRISPNGEIPDKWVSSRTILRFNLCNSGDTARSVWLFPGFFCYDARLYVLRPGLLTPLASIAPRIEDSLSFRKITVDAHDSVTIFASLRFAKTYLNRLRPRLVHPDYLNSFMVGLRDARNDDNLPTFLFCGLLLMMILYSLANFFQGANKEFLYYSGYALFLGLMLFLKAMFSFHATRFAYFQEEYLDFILQGTGYLFYMLFMEKYLATRSRYPFLYRLYNAGIVMLIISVSSYTFFHYFTGSFVPENIVENSTKVILLLMNLVFLVYSVRHWKDVLLRYLFWGNLCLFIFSLLSQLAIMADEVARQLPGIMRSSLFYYEIGLFLELVFFLMALNYKNRKQLIAEARERERLKAENQVKEYEKELAVFKAQQQERERISADIHDELGSGMTAIRLMSEIARKKMKQDVPAEIEKISQSADEVLNKMNAIIWSMDSGNDTIDNLVSYIRSYALEYFENTPIECKVNTPAHIERAELTGDKRRNIFLCVKETLNNALKHSAASKINVDFGIDDKLTIRISDNGTGFNLHKIRQFGNGLKNIARRMESIGGHAQIESDQGTITTLTLPL